MTVFRSRTADIDIPSVTLTGLVEAAVQRHADATAVIDGLSGQSLTYRELGRSIEQVASGLETDGLLPGDVAAIVAPNSLDWLVAALGVIRAGGVVTGANPACVVDELVHQFRDSQARVAFVSSATFDVAAVAAQQAGCVEYLVALDEIGGPALGLPVLAFSDLASGADVDAGAGQNRTEANQVCALPYSSGTTGRSKGVRLTHRSMVSNISQVAAVAPVNAGDRVLAFLPMFHIMGFAVVALGGLVKGATLVTLPGFEPRSFLTAIQSHRVTNLFVVPPIANFLAAHPMIDEFDLSSVATLGCGAAPLGAETERLLRNRLGCDMAQGYGMTESSGCISYPQFGDVAATGSSGGLLPNTEAMVVDPETGRPQPAGATGELWFRGPQVFDGYLDNPDATAETIDADGWVHTGDLGHFDAAGFLHITDRLKELIKVKGFQVAPADLEALLLTHPAVADVAVIGRTDERAGERPVAYVVGESGSRTDVDEIAAWVAERVSHYKRLAEVVLVEAIPRNPSGKILRRVLRALDSDGAR